MGTMANKNGWNLEEVIAWKKAYGHVSQNREILWAVLKPTLILGGVSYLFYHYWWLSIVFGLVGALYGYRVMLRVSARRVYETKAFNERDKFIKLMTQALFKESRTVLNALSFTFTHLNGELKEDVRILRNHLRGTTDEEKNEAFLAFAEKYRDDNWFYQYALQLKRASIEGRMSERAFTNLSHCHNETKIERERYMSQKQKRALDYIQMTWATFGFVLFTAVSLGWSNYVQHTAHQPLGWIADSIYFLAAAIVFHLWYQRATDDNNTEV
ncbi:hypothetical protein [Sporolactobacillus sp. KGMB 08714]|uniref:hypothetical protein n=1 Tax=Sporolactobacillus sp. KGMB 08714 TaxID=3064704 RepID=UPI002FBDC6F7